MWLDDLFMAGNFNLLLTSSVLLGCSSASLSCAYLSFSTLLAKELPDDSLPFFAAFTLPSKASRIDCADASFFASLTIFNFCFSVVGASTIKQSCTKFRPLELQQMNESLLADRVLPPFKLLQKAVVIFMRRLPLHCFFIPINHYCNLLNLSYIIMENTAIIMFSCRSTGIRFLNGFERRKWSLFALFRCRIRTISRLP